MASTEARGNRSLGRGGVRDVPEGNRTPGVYLLRLRARPMRFEDRASDAHRDARRKSKAAKHPSEANHVREGMVVAGRLPGLSSTQTQLAGRDIGSGLASRLGGTSWHAEPLPKHGCGGLANMGESGLEQQLFEQKKLEPKRLRTF